MTVDIIPQSISTKVWDRAGIEHATPGSAVGLATVCAIGLDVLILEFEIQRGFLLKSEHLN